MNKIFNKKNSVVIVFVLIGILALLSPVKAGVWDGMVISFFGFFVTLVVWILGILVGIITDAIFWVTPYNNFINEEVVVYGWTIVRDLCNMFFIVIFLIIAFATILKIENYNVKKLLPKLLIMAVLINFSRTICGLLIDIGQVVMLTFINALGESQRGSFMNLLGVDKYLSMAQSQKWQGDINLTSTLGGMILGILFMAIAISVLVVILGVFVMRMVILWIYVILSPIAFLLLAFPAGKKYAERWWSEFSQAIVSGPILAFFLWLALYSVGRITSLGDNSSCFGPAEILCPSTFINFVVAIGLLIGGLRETQKLGGDIGNIAGGGLGWAKKVPRAMAKTGGMALGWGAVKVKSGAVSDLFAKRVEDKDGNVTGWEGRGPLGKLGAGVAGALYGLEVRPTKIVKGVGAALGAKWEEDEAKGVAASSEGLKGGGALGLIKGLGVSQDLTNSLAHGFLWHKGFSKAKNTIVGTEKRRKELSEDIKEKRGGLGYTPEEITENDQRIVDTDKSLERVDNELKSLGDKDQYDKKSDEYKKVQGLESQKENIIKDGVNLEEKGKEMRKNQMSEKDRKVKEQEINTLENELDKIQPIQTYYADREREGLIREAKSKIGDNDNEEDLFAQFKNAVASDDQATSGAVLLHAANVFHGNEMMQNWKSTEDVKDEEGNVLIKEGAYLSQSGLGLNTLINQALIGKLGMGKQQAYAIQREISTIAKAKNHINYSETIGMKNGMLYQRESEDQQKRARNEERKTDAERSIRGSNRIAWGDEIQAYDPITGKDKRTFKLNSLGKMKFTEWVGTVATEIGRERFNGNAAMNIYEDREGLREWVEELKDQGLEEVVIKDPKSGTVRKTTYRSIAEDLIEYGRNISLAEGAIDKAGATAEATASKA